ncbi:MAG: Gfo/Idh/MocA family oxidoreductase, partial [Desulfobulbaceae bacterium]|nr:Gfo/Idh/MocA family oxidoreductase [Desulfobulbaceae bacterium]
MKMEPHILVIGSGSAGKRHAGNLHRLGCTISCFDPRQDRVDEVAALLPIAGGYTSLGKAWSALAKPYSGVVIASPPSFHVAQAINALERGVPVLLEKPVSPDLAGAQKLAQVASNSGVPLLLGYTWRWWPPLCRVKELLAEGIVGELLHVQFVLSAHLADWHPWENYQDFFMASKDLGGGALLDESHWLDLMLWLFGMPVRLFARLDTVSELEINTDDNVDMIIEYDGRLRVGIHLDLYGRPHERSISFTGTKGTLRWKENQIMIGRSAESRWEEQSFQY